MKTGQWTAVLLSGMATALAMPAAHAGWVTPSLISPPPVPTPCNPKPFTTQRPARACSRATPCWRRWARGYILRSMFSGPITINGINVGTVYDRVYCLGSGTTCTTTRCGREHVCDRYSHAPEARPVERPQHRELRDQRHRPRREDH